MLPNPAAPLPKPVAPDPKPDAPMVEVVLVLAFPPEKRPLPEVEEVPLEKRPEGGAEVVEPGQSNGLELAAFLKAAAGSVIVDLVLEPKANPVLLAVPILGLAVEPKPELELDGKPVVLVVVVVGVLELVPKPEVFAGLAAAVEPKPVEPNLVVVLPKSPPAVVGVDPEAAVNVLPLGFKVLPNVVAGFSVVVVLAGVLVVVVVGAENGVTVAEESFDPNGVVLPAPNLAKDGVVAGAEVTLVGSVAAVAGLEKDDTFGKPVFAAVLVVVAAGAAVAEGKL